MVGAVPVLVVWILLFHVVKTCFGQPNQGAGLDKVLVAPSTHNYISVVMWLVPEIMPAAMFDPCFYVFVGFLMVWFLGFDYCHVLSPSLARLEGFEPPTPGSEDQCSDSAELQAVICWKTGGHSGSRIQISAPLFIRCEVPVPPNVRKLVVDAGFEPATFIVSQCRATATPIDQRFCLLAPTH